MDVRMVSSSASRLTINAVADEPNNGAFAALIIFVCCIIHKYFTSEVAVPPKAERYFLASTRARYNSYVFNQTLLRKLFSTSFEWRQLSAALKGKRGWKVVRYGRFSFTEMELQEGFVIILWRLMMYYRTLYGSGTWNWWALRARITRQQVRALSRVHGG